MNFPDQILPTLIFYEHILVTHDLRWKQFEKHSALHLAKVETTCRICSRTILYLLVVIGYRRTCDAYSFKRISIQRGNTLYLRKEVHFHGIKICHNSRCEQEKKNDKPDNFVVIGYFLSSTHYAIQYKSKTILRIKNGHK